MPGRAAAGCSLGPPRSGRPTAAHWSGESGGRWQWVAVGVGGGCWRWVAAWCVVRCDGVGPGAYVGWWLVVGVWCVAAGAGAACAPNVAARAALGGDGRPLRQPVLSTQHPASPRRRCDNTCHPTAAPPPPPPQAPEVAARGEQVSRGRGGPRGPGRAGGGKPPGCSGPFCGGASPCLQARPLPPNGPKTRAVPGHSAEGIVHVCKPAFSP